jgi:uncharacterized YigZ family protein
MRIPLGLAETEIEIRKSRFIAIAKPVTTTEEVKQEIALVRKAYPQANHVVHAAVLGKNGTEYSASDDHEPKNTAGRPVLEVVKGSGITNVVVMVVRYFGGTLLGTGGLVKAYTDAAKAVIDILETEELIQKDSFRLVVGYEFYDQVKLLLQSHGAQTQEDFGTQITIFGTVATTETASIVQSISDLSSGKYKLEILGQ